ncbi:MAG: type I-C CRISPR-associated protein Cas8c/Csd1 [Lachnospiraceae bacterium]|nr:type I-C CRISPR-associated protein Cas8c/Csd1 [Lachnospiraceae bacterium]
MGLLQWAVETYDANESIVGVETEGKSPLAPIGHTLTNSQIEITLNSEGRFVNALKVDKSEGKIIIPVTEESAGRTVDPRAHPLCEQLGYLYPENDKKYKLYISQLKEWIASPYSHDKLLPVFKYVASGSIIKDLSMLGIIEVNERGIPKDEKLLVRWRIIGNGEGQEACWRDISLFKCYSDYYLSKIQKNVAAPCMVLGKSLPVAEQHMKGVVPFNGNAKLISANDSSGFTFRGRFRDDTQAVSISYIASQKAHNALRFLVNNQGVSIGGRTYLCWCPQGIEIPRCTHPLRKKGNEDVVVMPSEYRADLRNTLNGWKNDLQEIKQANAVIAVFDAATTGRLALAYYSEMQASDFLQRLYDWDEGCVWINGKYGAQSPYLKQIAECAYGTERSTGIQADDRVVAEQVQRLVRCRIDRQPFPVNIERMLVQRASEPQKYNKGWEKVLYTACAVVRKYHFDHKKEVLDMALEREREDRSYQFGRLLAILEKIERDTYHEETGREPNAIRRMSVYCKRPYHTFVQIEQTLEQAYIPHLNPGARIWYKQMIGEILGMLERIGALSEDVIDRPLEDTYLLGYYLQRGELYKKKEETDPSDNIEKEEVE